MMHLLCFTTLYPNARQPNHGVFVENRLRHLVASGGVSATVLAPQAWFPGRAAGAPLAETRHGLSVLHPRWLAIPRIGMRLAPALLYRASARALASLLAAGHRFDAIDAHYFYPDGVAAIRLGQRFNLPVVITARGSDVTQFPDYPAPRRMILAAAQKAGAIITVSASLRDALIRLGAQADKITVLRNGVDLAMFRPADRALARVRLGLAEADRVLVSVGGLIARKGHDRTIAAMAHLPEWRLLIAGQGPERGRLEALASRLGVGGRVKLLGPVPHAELAGLYSAADLSVLASSREGWANVLLESMACGTAVIASPIPGNQEVVASPAAGMLMTSNSPQAIVACVRAWEAAPVSRLDTRAFAEHFSWDATTLGQLAIFNSLIRP